ncbi:winged helix-turn-helix domain-containing protein [Nocardia caishijiensis]|uniref:Mrr restriction endonuclease-like protein n=1 Tax=Nocardia caishijiensis TaxID=184756 RepID=A0ABQ6YES1_9NOCA|nr:winged helix-turn-helix domain-containing protein [Nocardia caishijiensis]KAF0835765.1 Mrr restriction endonuclease-like protein [Nocardia caishijiensis]
MVRSGETGPAHGELAEVLPSGPRHVDNRIGWALSALYRGKLVDRPARATFLITDAAQGRKKVDAAVSGNSP